MAALPKGFPTNVGYRGTSSILLLQIVLMVVRIFAKAWWGATAGRAVACAVLQS